MPAFSDERLIDAAGAVVADRPEQRLLLVVAVASRLEVVVDAPPTPPTEPSAGVERWIGSIKLYRLWLKHRSSCLSPSLGAYGLQDAPPRSGQPNTTSGNSITKSPSVRPVVASFAQPFLCVRDDLMPDRLLPGPQVPVIFRIARDCEADHTAAAVGKRHAADNCMLVCLYASVRHTEADGSAPCKGEHIHDDRCSDRH